MVAIGWKFKTGWSDINLSQLQPHLHIWSFSHLLHLLIAPMAHSSHYHTCDCCSQLFYKAHPVFCKIGKFCKIYLCTARRIVIHSTVLRDSCRQYCIWSLQRHICDWPIWWSNPILIVATTHSFNCSVSSAGTKVPSKIHAVSKYWPRFQIYTSNRSANTFHPSFVIHNFSYFAASSL